MRSARRRHGDRHVHQPDRLAVRLDPCSNQQRQLQNQAISCLIISLCVIGDTHGNVLTGT
jgi:hypothetical protein